MLVLLTAAAICILPLAVLLGIVIDLWAHGPVKR